MFVHLPLLEKMRELYALPRGMERFFEYVRTLTGGGADVVLPLVSMNPMAKTAAPACVDALLALGAEDVVREAVEEANRRLRIVRELKVSLVVADDAQGGWTQRQLTDFSYRFGDQTPMLRRGFVVALAWSSEQPTKDRVRASALKAMHRALRAAAPKTLRDMLAQERDEAEFAGETAPVYGPRVERYLDASDQPTLIAALYGDDAAVALGYSPLPGRGEG